MAHHSQKSRMPPPAPVTVYVPGESGELIASRTIDAPTSHRFDDYEGDSVVYRYRLIAIQETGEEMFAGKARSYSHAMDLRDKWMSSHPEHRGVSIETL